MEDLSIVVEEASLALDGSTSMQNVVNLLSHPAGFLSQHFFFRPARLLSSAGFFGKARFLGLSYLFFRLPCLFFHLPCFLFGFAPDLVLCLPPFGRLSVSLKEIPSDIRCLRKEGDMGSCMLGLTV